MFKLDFHVYVTENLSAIFTVFAPRVLFPVSCFDTNQSLLSLQFVCQIDIALYHDSLTLSGVMMSVCDAVS